MKIYDVAAIWHNARGRLRQAYGIRNQVLWGAVPESEKDETVALVKLCLLDPPRTPEELHLRRKERYAGKSAFHSLPYNLLSKTDIAELQLFKAIITALGPLVDPEELHEGENAS